MDRRAAWVLGIVFGGMFLCLFGFLLVLYLAVKSDGPRGRSDGTDKVGVVEISGTIMDSKKVLKELKEFAEDEHIKAIVVRIDSPGGAVGPSQEIYDAVQRISQKKKVVASMGSIAASGGFYIACAADKVYANAGTLTGSIGVIMQMPNVEGLMKWAGVEMNTLTAGKMKDAGSPFRTMSEDERAYFLSMLADVHEQFIEAVAKGRKLPIDELRPLADGRVFSGRQAKAAKLVDELGGLEAAVAEAGKLGGLIGEIKTEYPQRERKLLRELLGDDEVKSLAQEFKQQVLSELGGSGLQYRLAVP